MDNHILQLPNFIFKRISWYITKPVDIVNLYRTCKRYKDALKDMVEDDNFWRQVCLICFPARNLDKLPEGLPTWRHYYGYHYFRVLPTTTKTIPLRPPLSPPTQAPPRGGGTQAMKVVFIGTGTSGKTTFITRYVCGEFRPNLAKVFDNYSKDVVVCGRRVNLGLWDTAGTADYSRLRPLSYPPTDLFIIMFSLVDPTTLWDVAELWYPEMSHHCPSTQFILVGTKKDLRDTRTENIVTTGQGMAIAFTIGASVYIECSAFTGENLDLVFEQGVLCVFGGYMQSKQKRCNVQ